MAIEFVNNFLMINSINKLDYFLLFFYIMLSGFLEHLALEVNIDCLIKAYKLSMVLQNLITFFVGYNKKIDLYITNLEYLCLPYHVFKEKSLYSL